LRPKTDEMVGTLPIQRRLPRETEAELRALLDCTSVGFAVLDEDLCFRRVNRVIAEMDGFSVGEHEGRRFADLVPEMATTLEPLIRGVLETGKPVVELDVSGTTPRWPGEERHWIVSYFPVKLDGRIDGVAVSMVDITERRRYERASELLASAGDVLSSSIDLRTMLDGIAALLVPGWGDFCALMLHEHGEPTLVAARHVDPDLLPVIRRFVDAGIDWSSPIGLPHVLRTGEAQLVASMDPATRRKLARDDAAMALIDKLGPTSAAVAPLTVQGTVLGGLVVATSRSKRRLGEWDLTIVEELGRRVAMAVDNARLFELAQEERRRVEAANRAKDEFLAVVSHELRSPMNSILGWARMLRTDHLSEAKAEKALETIERNAVLQSQLISDLLDATAVFTGKLRLRIGSCDLVEITEAALEVVRPAAAAKEIDLLAQYDAEAIPVEGDPERLQQVIWNLLANAVKFSPRGGSVDLTVRLEGERVRIEVKDQGKGIGPEFLPHVFDAFSQEDARTTRRHGGLGLGLSIVRHLVEAHGGRIEAESDGEGSGATFKVELPRGGRRAEAPAFKRESRVPPAPASMPRLMPPSLDGLSVLVLDDDNDARELITEVLRAKGAHVMEADSAEDALRAVTEKRPQVIVSDIGMPGVDGYMFLRRVRELPAERGGQTPAIALTAYGSAADRSRALLSGFQRHLAKPVEPALLVTELATLSRRTAA
jgi:PAS domain S-box-containing protein